VNKLYAFWGYDIFPKICSGEVLEINDKGWCSIKGYGPGSWFDVDKIVSLKSGKKIRIKLDNLEKAYKEQENMLRKRFSDERDRIIKL